ncbi:MAG: protein translocase subunit SecD [Dethiosulfovibrio peptidovorans]|nr:MAG: protein translocase subunit SecD [Dethiosulfovibrio peptidovorans]
MLKKDRWRLALVAVVVVAALASVFPIKGRVHLGLDLKGGAHILLQAKGIPENPLTNDSVERLLAVLRNRVDQYGVSEPVIQREGENRVIVDLPGVENPEQALELIGKTALLEFRQVLQATAALPPQAERKNYDSDEEYERAVSRWNEVKAQRDSLEKDLRARAETKSGGVVADDDSGRIYLLGEVYVSGKDLKGAKATYDNLGRPVVSLEFNDTGAKLFDAATETNVGKQIAIVLDGMVVSAPVVQERISGGSAQISGSFSPEEARNLAIMLRAGALPVPVEVLENRSVGPTLGTDSIKAGLKAGFIGCVLVVLFMLIYYRVLGLAADVALVVTMLLLFALLISFKATLTLPGIAGIILTIGMAVDGNILIYERVKEEYRDGKTPLASLDSGFKKAFKTILDANITTLIAAAVLYYFGSGPVRGFALTLAFGIVASVFSAVLVTRVLLQIMVSHNSIPSLARRR